MLRLPAFFLNEQQMIDGLTDEPLDVWVNSYGGCASNYFSKLLSSNGWITSSRTYSMKACHYYKPLPINVRYAIFLYRENFINSLGSQIKRGLYHNYFKCRCFNRHINFDMNRWLDSISQQITNWTQNKILQTMIINFDQIPNNLDKVRYYLNIPSIKITKSSDNSRYVNLEQYGKKIDHIQQKINLLPNFRIINEL